MSQGAAVGIRKKHTERRSWVGGESPGDRVKWSCRGQGPRGAESLVLEQFRE